MFNSRKFGLKFQQWSQLVWIDCKEKFPSEKYFLFFYKTSPVAWPVWERSVTRFGTKKGDLALWKLPAALLCRCRTTKQNGRCWREQSEQNCFISVPNFWFNMLVSLSYGGFPMISVALDHWTREKSCPKRSQGVNLYKTWSSQIRLKCFGINRVQDP